MLHMKPDTDGNEAPVQSIHNFELINQVQYLYLRSSSEPTDNSLRIIVEEASSSDARASSLSERSVTRYRPIESTEISRTFELYWKHYLAYLVTEECVGSCGKYDDEVYTGKLLRHYAKSHFLNHLARDTGGHMTALRHYKFICLNHLIDVASEEPPEIALVKG
jgi:hypothetical protein